ncbi:MAG: pimeloyl-ACP methyl ester carboxylesterase, partial [Flavobacteriales bacterium]
MKRFTFFMALVVSCSWLAEPCHAQTLEERFEHIYSPLDKREMTSGIFIHQTPVFLWPGRYDGRNVADSMRLSLDQFGILYGQFRGAAIGKSVLPHPNVYLSKALDTNFKNDTIRLTCMAMGFDKIKVNARDNNLLEYGERQIFDVPGRSQSPYEQDTCFALTALHQKLEGTSFQFLLPEELLFTNLERFIDKVKIDFDDGKGLQDVAIGEALKIDYKRDGRKTILLEYQLNGIVYTMATYIEIQKPISITADDRGAMDYDKANGFEFPFTGMDITIFPACDDGGELKLRRPLIFLDGFGGSKKADDMFKLLEEALDSNGDVLLDYFNDNEYDLVWIDYWDGFESVEKNADYLINVIDWINVRKHLDGSSEPNTLFGFSMGGMVSKMAILKMHNELDKQSEVERFFSYDAPLKGANYPIGIQAFIRDLFVQAENIGVSTASLAVASQLLDSPAAKDLLSLRVTDIVNGSFVLSSGDFNANQNRINNLESIRPLGAIVHHVAISNGANFGTLQESMLSTENILGFHVELDEVADASSPEICYNVVMDAKAYMADGTNTLLYERTITSDVNLLCEIWAEDYDNSTEDAISLVVPSPLSRDDAPGSSSGIGLSPLRDGMYAIIDEFDHVTFSYAHLPIEHIMFIPTISSLGMPSGTSITTPAPTGGAGVRRWSASNDNTVELQYSQMQEFNQEHVTANKRIVDLINSELSTVPIDGLGTSLSSGEIYNFGKSFTSSNTTLLGVETPKVIEEDLIIHNGGELWVNRDDLLGYMNNPNTNSRPQSFTVTVPDIDCNYTGQADVVVANGGQIIIGDESISNIGHLYFGKNSSLEINGQDGVLVEEGSTLGIYGGAQATIEPNAKLQLNREGQCIIGGGDGNVRSRLHVKAGSTLRIIRGATVVIEDGGILEIDAGVDLDLWWPASSIHVKDGGELRINGDFSFDGQGYFQFDEGNILSFGPNATRFRLFGTEARDHRFIQVNEDAVLNFGDKDLYLDRGQINYKAGSSITMSGGYVDLFGVTFQGDDSNVGTFEIDSPDWIFSDRCWFKDVESCMEISNFIGTGASATEKVLIRNAEITNSINGFIIENSTQVKFEYCKFKGIVAQALYVATVNLVEFFNSSVREYADPFAAGNGIELANDVGIFRMRRSTIDGARRGIYVPCRNNDENISNVILESGAIIMNCAVDGIHIGKGGVIPDGSNENYGLVRMRCSKLLDNWTGISGVDVLLDIDGCDFIGTSCMPNTFKLGLGLH